MDVHVGMKATWNTSNRMPHDVNQLTWAQAKEMSFAHRICSEGVVVDILVHEESAGCWYIVALVTCSVNQTALSKLVGTVSNCITLGHAASEVPMLITRTQSPSYRYMTAQIHQETCSCLDWREYKTRQTVRKLFMRNMRNTHNATQKQPTQYARVACLPLRRVVSVFAIRCVDEVRTQTCPHFQLRVPSLELERTYPELGGTNWRFPMFPLSLLFIGEWFSLRAIGIPSGAQLLVDGRGYLYVWWPAEGGDPIPLSY